MICYFLCKSFSTTRVRRCPEHAYEKTPGYLFIYLLTYVLHILFFPPLLHCLVFGLWQAERFDIPSPIWFGRISTAEISGQLKENSTMDLEYRVVKWNTASPSLNIFLEDLWYSASKTEYQMPVQTLEFRRHNWSLFFFMGKGEKPALAGLIYIVQHTSAFL